jgi:hypothetical protein
MFINVGLADVAWYGYKDLADIQLTYPLTFPHFKAGLEFGASNFMRIGRGLSL